MVKEPEMETFFEGDQRKGCQRQRELPTFHAEFAHISRRLAPLRCGAGAQSPDLQDGDEVQRRADEGETDHGYAQPTGMQAIKEGGNFCREGERTDANDKAQPRHGHEEGADALQKSKEQARPTNPEACAQASPRRKNESIAGGSMMRRNSTHNYSSRRRYEKGHLSPSVYSYMSQQASCH